MWIWYVSRSDGGDPAAMVWRARANGIKTLFIKAGDGGGYWSQFNSVLVGELEAGGVHVCAWQYVYGADPIGEAAVGARAVANGAQCLVIDAEAEYEGRYASAQVYLRALRAAVGWGFPVGLASFPYDDYHPAFPYSVFLGPGGAQYDLPQMYWSEIGATVGAVFEHTYTQNRIYGRPIVPIGETDAGVTGLETMLFRGMDVRYGAPGISWWDYAWTTADGLWPSISGFYTVISAVPPLGFPYLHLGSRGDEVVRLQELLAGFSASVGIDGDFGPLTQAALERFQWSRGLAVSGWTDGATWLALRRLRPVQPAWAVGGSADTGVRRGYLARAPLSASMPPVRDEIRPQAQRAEPTGTS
jgi:hypothetical protein